MGSRLGLGGSGKRWLSGGSDGWVWVKRRPGVWGRPGSVRDKVRAPRGADGRERLGTWLGRAGWAGRTDRVEWPRPTWITALTVQPAPSDTAVPQWNSRDMPTSGSQCGHDWALASLRVLQLLGQLSLHPGPPTQLLPSLGAHRPHTSGLPSPATHAEVMAR